MTDLNEYYCRTCRAFISEAKVISHARHDTVPAEWVKTCGSCNGVIENDWHYCAWCGQKFGDW